MTRPLWNDFGDVLCILLWVAVIALVLAATGDRWLP